MPCVKSLRLGCVLIVLISVAVNAQETVVSAATVVPPLVNFSGSAINDQGKPIAGPLGVTFSIYNTQQGGAPLWMETQNVQADAKGNYTVQLGAMSSEGLPLGLFTSGEARWLGVRVNGNEEQLRVLLLSVPYALKAADAQTLGGLPASAFVLAAPSGNGAISPSSSTVVNQASSPNVGGSGTENYIPLWTDNSGDLGNSILFQLGTGSSAKIGINETDPLLTLDVNGSELVRGLFEMATQGFATSAKAYNSQPLNIESSAFNSGTNKYTLNHFEWQAEPTGNNTANPGATLNLLYGTDPAAPTETGLKLSNSGVFTFAPGQTFPGTGTVTSVALSAPASDFTVSGSPLTNSGTLGLNWTVAPTSAATASAIVKRDATGSFSAMTVNATNSTGGFAVNASDTSSVGSIAVYGSSNNGTGVVGSSNNSFGVWGESNLGSGIFGTSNANGGVGVAGSNSSGQYGIGVMGSGVMQGVFGTGNTGVSGQTTTIGGYGVSGLAPNGTGVYGSGNPGVYGQSTSNYGVSGQSSTSFGVYGQSTSSDGVYGQSNSQAGVYGTSNSGWGVYGYGAATATGVLAGSAAGYAGWFNGNVQVEGNFSVSGHKNFRIDHPLDPANKYLLHSSVESSEMKDMYDGVVTTNHQGEATVKLPEWFEALNEDFRYQLTVIGQFAQAIVSREIHQNEFHIKTNLPDVKVSWQVTGVRRDAYAKAHPLQVEEDKPAQERGFYLHPELYGAPEEKGILWAMAPKAMEKWKQARDNSQIVPAPAAPPTIEVPALPRYHWPSHVSPAQQLSATTSAVSQASTK